MAPTHWIDYIIPKENTFLFRDQVRVFGSMLFFVAKHMEGLLISTQKTIGLKTFRFILFM